MVTVFPIIIWKIYPPVRRVSRCSKLTLEKFNRRFRFLWNLRLLTANLDNPDIILRKGLFPIFFRYIYGVSSMKKSILQAYGTGSSSIMCLVFFPLLISISERFHASVWKITDRYILPVGTYTAVFLSQRRILSASERSLLYRVKTWRHRWKIELWCPLNIITTPFWPSGHAFISRLCLEICSSRRHSCDQPSNVPICIRLAEGWVSTFHILLLSSGEVWWATARALSEKSPYLPSALPTPLSYENP